MKGGEVLRKQIHTTQLQLFPFVHIPDHEEAEATGFDSYSPLLEMWPQARFLTSLG